MPKHALAHLKSEYVSAAVAFLSSEECVVSGHVISAGAGYFARTQMMEGEGVFLEGDAAADPDAVAAAYERISDLSKAVPFASAPEYIDKVLGRFADQPQTP
jgi:hypothetical protein